MFRIETHTQLGTLMSLSNTVVFVVLRDKWPKAIRANGHLLLNSEKVNFILT